MSDLFDVSKETILITGACRGWGGNSRGCCPRMARRGAGGAPDRETEGLEEEIRGKGGRAAAVQMDVTDMASIGKAHRCRGGSAWPGQRADQQCRHRHREARGRADRGRLGRRHQRQSQGRLFPGDRNGAADDRAQAGRQHRQYRLRARLRRDEIPSPYTISKAGIVQATKAMALELAGNRIRVNALAPGYIDTEMNHDFWATPAGEKLTKRIPQRRVGAESDLDGAILLLASQRLALHDRQRGHGRWRVFAERETTLVVLDSGARVDPEDRSLRDLSRRMARFVRRRLCVRASPNDGSRARVDSIRPHLAPDHVGGLLADHDGRRVGVAADQGRHDRGIDHAQAFAARKPSASDRPRPSDR